MKKLSLQEAKDLDPVILLDILRKMKQDLRHDETMQKVFKDYGLDIAELQYIPMKFGDLDVSAKTDHGIIIFNYKLLCNGDFEQYYGYAVHEITHVIQQTTGTHPTQGADDGNYLENKYEQEGFKNQVEYLSSHFGEDEAERYVDHLLDYHNVKNPQEKDELEAIFLENV